MKVTNIKYLAVVFFLLIAVFILSEGKSENFLADSKTGIVEAYIDQTDVDFYVDQKVFNSYKSGRIFSAIQNIETTNFILYEKSFFVKMKVRDSLLGVTLYKKV